MHLHLQKPKIQPIKFMFMHDKCIQIRYNLYLISIISGMIDVLIELYITNNPDHQSKPGTGPQSGNRTVHSPC